LIEKLLYDNSSLRPQEEFVSANSDAASESFSPSPILVKDSDSLMEEIIYYVLRTTQCCRALWTRIMTLKGIFSFVRTCLAITPFHLLKQSHSILIFLRFLVLLQKPPDGDTGILNIKMMGDISYQKDFMHKLMITLAPHQEKSPDLLSHRCGTVKKFNTHRSHLNKCSMLIQG
nr:hypothetical protein [Tanacetum cinerariifolium]